MPKIIKDFDQGSSDWFSYKVGMIGGTAINKIMSKGQGKMRKQLMLDLVGEMLSGEKKGGFVNNHMEEGLLHEGAARDLYAFMNDVEVEEVALIVRSSYFLCSPDGLVGDDGLIEIKTVIPSVYVEYRLGKSLPTAYRRQVQWELYISERDWCDFVVYCPYLKTDPGLIIQRFYRDETEISGMVVEAENFVAEMIAMYEEVSCD